MSRLVIEYGWALFARDRREACTYGLWESSGEERDRLRQRIHSLAAVFTTVVHQKRFDSNSPRFFFFFNHTSLPPPIKGTFFFLHRTPKSDFKTRTYTVISAQQNSFCVSLGNGFRAEIRSALKINQEEINPDGTRRQRKTAVKFRFIRCRTIITFIFILRRTITHAVIPHQNNQEFKRRREPTLHEIRLLST